MNKQIISIIVIVAIVLGTLLISCSKGECNCTDNSGKVHYKSMQSFGSKVQSCKEVEEELNKDGSKYSCK